MVDYAKSVELAPPGWRHFTVQDIDRLPPAVREHELGRVPQMERDLVALGDAEAVTRVERFFFWTFVYHLDPERWDELAQVEPIHPEILAALPAGVSRALDIGAGSGRLTRHLVTRSSRVTAVEPSAGLRRLLRERLPSVIPIAGWAEALPLGDACSDLTAACGALGPDPVVLDELRRVTAPGGVIALVSPECPEWFEAHGWRRITATPVRAPLHPRWIDDFFGPPDPPHELVMIWI